jgi:hypothetical protein
MAGAVGGVGQPGGPSLPQEITAAKVVKLSDTQWKVSYTILVQPKDGPPVRINMVYTHPTKDQKPVDREEVVKAWLPGALAIVEMIQGKGGGGLSSGEVQQFFRLGAELRLVQTREEGKSHLNVFISLPARQDASGAFQPILDGSQTADSPRKQFVLQKRGHLTEAVHITQLEAERANKEAGGYKMVEFDPTKPVPRGTWQEKLFGSMAGTLGKFFSSTKTIFPTYESMADAAVERVKAIPAAAPGQAGAVADAQATWILR